MGNFFSRTSSSPLSEEISRSTKSAEPVAFAEPQALCKMLCNRRSWDNNQWLGVGRCLFTISPDLLPLWKEFSRQSGRAETCQKYWPTFQPGDYGLAVLHHWASNDDYETYRQWNKDNRGVFQRPPWLLDPESEINQARALANHHVVAEAAAHADSVNEWFNKLRRSIKSQAADHGLEPLHVQLKDKIAAEVAIKLRAQGYHMSQLSPTEYETLRCKNSRYYQQMDGHSWWAITIPPAEKTPTFPQPPKETTNTANGTMPYPPTVNP